MLRTIIILIALCSISWSQLISETFSNFVRAPLDSTKGLWVFCNDYHDDISGEADIIYDISGKDNDLSIGGWANIAAVEADMSGTVNPVYQGGDTLGFNGSSEYFYISSGASGDLNPAADDFTIIVWVRQNPNAVGDDELVAKYSAGAAAQYRYWSDDGAGDFRLTDNSSNTASTALANYGLLDGRWAFTAFTVDRTNDVANGWYSTANGVLTKSTDRGIAALVDNITPSAGVFYIANLAGTTNFYYGSIALVSYHDRLLTTHEMREQMALAYGWHSKLGQVTREKDGIIYRFHQGFYNSDTIFYPLPDTTNKAGYQWQLHLNAKSGQNGSVIKSWIGSADNQKSNIWNQNLNFKSTDYIYNLGNVNISSDTLWFTVSANDTNYIDNIVINETLKSESWKINKPWEIWKLW